jgi:tRNA nucleotidyltransferase (CCA-adding enzyme)
VARFAARYAPLGFTIAEETLALMKRMVADGEANALVAERVWAETEKALGEPRPDVFISVLRECGALKVIYPEIDALFGVPQPAKWHPEIDTGVHQLLALREAVKLGGSVAVRFAVLMHDLGKAATPAEILPSHHGHEEAGVALVEQLAARLRVPHQMRELAVITSRHHTHVHCALELRTVTVWKTLENCDALRRPERFNDMLLACEADARGRQGLEQRDYPQRAFFAAARERAAAVALSAEERSGLTGEQIGEQLRLRRIAAIAELQAALPKPKGK